MQIYTQNNQEMIFFLKLNRLDAAAHAFLRPSGARGTQTEGESEGGGGGEPETRRERQDKGRGGKDESRGEESTGGSCVIQFLFRKYRTRTALRTRCADAAAAAAKGRSRRRRGRGMSCTCDDGYIHWVFRISGECMYGLSGQLSFSLGCASIGFWIVTQLPQMIENYRTGRADGLSAYFVLQWALGDSCNLVGCILSGQQVATETYTAVRYTKPSRGHTPPVARVFKRRPAVSLREARAGFDGPCVVARVVRVALPMCHTRPQIWFVLSDVLLGVQYMYYKLKTRRERRLKRMLRKSFLTNASRRDAGGRGGDEEGHGDVENNRRRGRDRAAAREERRTIPAARTRVGRRARAAGAPAAPARDPSPDRWAPPPR